MGSGMHKHAETRGSGGMLPQERLVILFLYPRRLLLVASEIMTLNIYDSEIYSSIYSYEGT